MDALFVLELGPTPFELGFLIRDHGCATLLRLERGGRSRDPVTPLLQLGREHTQLARLPVELEGLQAQPLDLALGPLDLGAAVLELLFTERQPPLPFDEFLLGVLDQLPPCIEIRGDLVEATCPCVDLARAPGHGLLQQALPFGERLPGLLELVALFGHSSKSCPANQMRA